MKKSLKLLCLLLSFILLICSSWQNVVFAANDVQKDYYITSYDCQEGTITTNSLLQTIKEAKDSGKILYDAPSLEIASKTKIEINDEQRMVFDDDEWEEVSPRDARVAYIRTYWKDGSSNTRGTAFFISNDTVVTSAHCIYNASRGGWCEYADIFPAKNGSTNPYGQISSDTIHLLTSYMSAPANDNDYAIIELESAPNVGYFGWSTSATSGQSIKIMGYPSYLVNDPPSGTSQIIKQYYDTGTINAAYTGYIRTTNTNTNGGSSGGPVLNSSDKVIAIVKGHTSSANIATRVDSYAAEWFSSFR